MKEAAIPEALGGESFELEAREGWLSWVASVDHKQLGIMYLLGAFFFFLVGGVLALMMRVQLAVPNSHFLSPEVYNQLFTMHGTTMVFLVLVPMLVGFATYMVPLMIGARDMAFPRLNALSFWVQIFGGVMLYFSFATSGINGGASAVGWFAYAPLSETAYSYGPGVNYWILGLLGIGVGTLTAGLNLIATIICLRAPGMSIRRVPLFVWMTMITAFLIVVVMPILNAGLVMLLIDRLLNAHFFRADTGGSAVLWQHVFWAFGHPEVYIMILPAFGIISEVMPVFSGKPIYGYDFVAASTLAIAFLSLAVWAHHMFAVGLGHAFDLFFGCQQHGDRGAHWSEDFQLDRDDVPGAGALYHLDAVRGGIPPDVHHRRALGRRLRGGADRLAGDRQLFRRRPSALRTVRRHRVRAVRRRLLLVSENQRPDARRALGQGAFLADAHRLQPDLHDPARARDARDAAAGVYLSRAARLGGDEHALDYRRVRARLLGADLHGQSA